MYSENNCYYWLYDLYWGCIQWTIEVNRERGQQQVHEEKQPAKWKTQAYNQQHKTEISLDSIFTCLDISWPDIYQQFHFSVYWHYFDIAIEEVHIDRGSLKRSKQLQKYFWRKYYSAWFEKEFDYNDMVDRGSMVNTWSEAICWLWI